MATGNDMAAARTFDFPGWNMTSTEKWVAGDGAKNFLRCDPFKTEGPPFSIDGAQTLVGITITESPRMRNAGLGRSSLSIS